MCYIRHLEGFVVRCWQCGRLHREGTPNRRGKEKIPKGVLGRVKRVFIRILFLLIQKEIGVRVDIICHDLVKQGILPISPLHLFSFMENDDNREEILQVCFRLIDICDEVWIYGDSEGCRKEREYALSTGKSVVIKYGKTSKLTPWSPKKNLPSHPLQAITTRRRVLMLVFIILLFRKWMIKGRREKWQSIGVFARLLREQEYETEVKNGCTMAKTHAEDHRAIRDFPLETPLSRPLGPQKTGDIEHSGRNRHQDCGWYKWRRLGWRSLLLRHSMDSTGNSKQSSTMR